MYGAELLVEVLKEVQRDDKNAKYVLLKSTAINIVLTQVQITILLRSCSASTVDH